LSKIRKLSIIAMIILVPMMLYYPYEGLRWNLELSFLDWGRWTRNDNWVDPEAQIALVTRTVFFVLWAVPTVLGLLGYACAFSMAWLLHKGIVFDLRISARLFWMGALIFMSSATALVAGAVSPMIRSWHNPDGPLPLRFWYDSGNIGLAFCGLAFLFLGLIMREAIHIALENEEFV
jgi:hypothetical protein